MNKHRKSRYKRLKEIRKERDYQMGVIQYANRPYTFRSARVNVVNGKGYSVFMTTSQFILKNEIRI